ncbi:MAG TPA: thioredoxin domain-containing protein [Hanamia sp.]|nr:thioredoxin domain-containing protein [Hanamia sp.]
MANKKEEIIIEPKDVIIGNPKALITIMQFIDYESEKSAQAHKITKEIMDAYKEEVNFNFRHFPLMRIHQKALKAAEAAVGAAQEGKFFEMHEMMIHNRKHLGIISLKSYAKEIGITNKSFLNNLINGKYGLYVHDDLKYGNELGVKEVPTFFINGKKIEEDVTVELLSSKINKALKKMKVNPRL